MNPRTKSIVITGASSGIGHATALRLARNGWRVFAAVRKQSDMQASSASAEVKFETIRLDVTDAESITTAATEVAGKLEGLSVVVIRQAGESGQLYGSVSARDIADAVTQAGFTIEKQQVVLERPIKSLGMHPVKVALHPEVSVTINANVAQSAEGADMQAKGIDPLRRRDEEEEEEVARAQETPAEPAGTR